MQKYVRFSRLPASETSRAPTCLTVCSSEAARFVFPVRASRSSRAIKDDVKEVKAGYECGLVFEGFNDIAELDIVEAYTMVEVPR